MDIDKDSIKKILKTISIIMLVFIVVFVIVSVISIFIFNIFYELIDKTFLSGSLRDYEAIDLSVKTITSFATVMTYKALFSIIFGFSLITTSYLTFKIFSNYGNLNKNQKGSSRFATLKEIQSQYRKVPEKEERFEGSGGVPVARYKDSIFIDDSPVNNLVIGTTRSGKGETFVFSSIDIYSRAKEQASMVINDPKGELFSASKETLEKLGYNVEILNLMTPEQSMSYNILQQTVDAFVSENYPLAEQYARSIGYMLFNDPHAKDPVWWKSSASLCTALILGLCEQCKHEPEKITMYNVALMLSDLGSREVFNETIGEKISALDDFFLQFPNNHPAKLQFSTVNFSTGQMRASILANTNSELDIFTVNGIGKLTSQTTFDTTKLGYKRWVKGKATPNERIEIKLPNDEIQTIRTNSNGIFSIFFENPISLNEEIKIKVKDKETIISITEKLHDGYYKTTSSSEDVKIIELVQYEKPTALFMVTPDYDATFNVIVSIFIKQVYADLARIASNIKSGKCQREVIFLLDEFGNMPTIEDFTNIITVCLGRNIRFNLIVQAYSQLEDKYGEGWKTIDGNCGNTMYILTADENTAERISKKLGDKTIVTKSRTGQPVSLSKSKTESIDSQRLLPSADVMALKEGEMLVIRVIKRQDVNRNRIRSYPLYLRGKTALKYRWEYLSEFYDTDKSINDFDIDCKHTMLNLDEFKVSFDENNYNKDFSKTTSNKEIENNVEEENPFAQNERSYSDDNVVINKRINEKKQKLQQSNRRKVQEIRINKRINENIKVKDTVPVGLLKNFLEQNEVQFKKYNEFGLIDFREYIMANDKEFDENLLKAILHRIESRIESVYKELEEGNVANEEK